MIDQYLISCVTTIANHQIHKRFPMLDLNHFKESEVRIICEAFHELAKEMLKEKKNASNKL